jgi:hypothetical protein
MHKGISRCMLTSLFCQHNALSLKYTELNCTTVKAQTYSHTYKLLHAMQVTLHLVFNVLTAYYIQDCLCFGLCIWPKDCQQIQNLLPINQSTWNTVFFLEHLLWTKARNQVILQIKLPWARIQASFFDNWN